MNDSLSGHSMTIDSVLAANVKILGGVMKTSQKGSFQRVPWFLGFLFLALSFVLTATSNCLAQQSSTAQTHPVSGFGTSFIFGPTPICQGCLQTELGFSSTEQTKLVPMVITYAPSFARDTDISLLFNALQRDNQSNEFGDRVDVIVRRTIYNRNGLTVGIAPRATVFLRENSGVRLGGTLAVQQAWEKDSLVGNVTLTGASSSAPSNPSYDYIGAVDYSHSFTQRIGAFVGFQHQHARSQPGAVSAEVGVVYAWKPSAQVEIAMQRLNFNTSQSTTQFSARVVVNWGRVSR